MYIKVSLLGVLFPEGFPTVNVWMFTAIHSKHIKLFASSAHRSRQVCSCELKNPTSSCAEINKAEQTPET